MAAAGDEIGRADTTEASRTWIRDGRLLAIASLVLFTAVFLKNAWVDEDAYITFRSIEQLFAGNGPRWNPHERVQAFTHPLWLALLSAGRVVSNDLFAVSLVVSYAAGLAMLAGIRRGLGSAPRLALVVVWMVSSKSFFDFTSSGLENPLAYALIPLYLIVLGRTLREAAPEALLRDLRMLSLLLGLLLLTRHDLFLLLAPAHVAASWRARRDVRSCVAALALGLSPFLVWTLYSLLYFGFPFPNTAYAKLATGIPRAHLVEQGLHYVQSLASDDLVTALTLVAGIGLLPFVHRFGTRRVPRAMGIALSAGIAPQLAYVVWIGGDYMIGRFFACSFLVALVGLVSQLEVSPRILGGAGLAALLVGWLSPGAPLLTGRDFAVERPNRHGIGDQRGIFFQTSSLHRWLARSSQDVFPDYRWTRAGQTFARSDDLVLVRANVGFMGHGAGTQKIIIDRLGLTDPLLARLPSMQIWRIGHFPRRVPDGYPESVESGESRIVDPGVRAFHEKLELITQSDLLAAGRLGAIVGMNLGLYDHLLEGEQ